MSTPNGQMISVRQGERMAIQGPQGRWMTGEEMREQFAARGGGPGGGAPGDAARGAGRGGAARGAGAGAAGRGALAMFGGAMRPPADQLATLVAQIKEAKVADGAIVAALSAEQAALMLTFGGRGGQTPPAPKNASGTAKFWLKDGAVVKYQIQVKGTVAGRDGQEREVDRTTTVEFKDVGSTKIDLPDEAKQKLGA
jgi:hypothetical protein